MLTPVTTYGAVGDAILNNDGMCTSGSTTFTSASANFQTTDVGKTIVITGAAANGGSLTTTIAGRTSATSITLATAAGFSASSLNYVYGTENTSAMQAACNSGNALCLPQGKYLMTGTVTYSLGSVYLVGCGDDSVIISDYKVFDLGSSGVPPHQYSPGFPHHLANFRMQNATILTPVAPGAFPTPNSATPVTVDRYATGIGYRPTSNDKDIWATASTLAPITTMSESMASVVTVNNVSNPFVTGQVIYIQGCTTFAWLNGQKVTVLATGLSASQFEFNDPTSHGPASAMEPSSVFSSVSPAQQSQTIGPYIRITQCDYSVVDAITGQEVVIEIYDSSYCDIVNCNFISRYSGSGGLGFLHDTTNGTGLVCKQNRIINNVVRFASHSGIYWQNCQYLTVMGNHSSYNGEAGFKNWDNSMGSNSFITITGNSSSYNSYDGFDISSESPHTDTVITNSIMSGNNSSYNNRTGVWGSGQYWVVVGNNIAYNNLTGLDLDMSNSVISENVLTGNNASNSSGNHQIFLGSTVPATNNILVGNRIDGTTAQGNAIAWLSLSTGNSMINNVATGCAFSRAASPFVSVGNEDVNGADNNLLPGDISMSGKMTSYTGLTTAGMGVPPIIYQFAQAGLSGNMPGSPVTISSPGTVGHVYRISGVCAIDAAAGTSSTLPSLTLGWKDVGNVTRTQLLVSANTGNSTGVIVTFNTVIYCAASPITLTSTGYLSSGSPSMSYSLNVQAELLK